MNNISDTISESGPVLVIGWADGWALAVEKVHVVGYNQKPRKQKKAKHENDR